MVDDCLATRAQGGALRFVRDVRQVIGAQHRSGWPYAVRSLQPLARDEGLLFDDFVEHNFCYGADASPYREPWVGVFHHPPNMPPFATDHEKLPVMFAKPAWRESRRHLRGAIALSQYLADYLAAELQVPTAVARHPSELSDVPWSEAAYLASPYQWLLQVGWYLRNTRAIFQVPPLRRHRKVRLWPPPRPPLHWVREYDDRVSDHWRGQNSRREWDDVTDYPLVSPPVYDQLLATHVILTEVFDASANNVVIECIVRSTPLVINRHPAVVEYLGAEYPLFFDQIEQVPELLSDERVLGAHRYLKSLDKSTYQGEAFRETIAAAVQRMRVGSSR